MTVGGRRAVGGIFNSETNDRDGGIVHEWVRKCWRDGAGGATSKRSVGVVKW